MSFDCQLFANSFAHSGRSDVQIMSRLVDLQAGYKSVALLLPGVCKDLTLLAHSLFAC
jgi:hypothetical protein